MFPLVCSVRATFRGCDWILIAPPTAGAAPSCPISYGSADDAKPNKVYLYYPSAADATFPEFGAVGGGPTSPAQPFDTSLLTS
jgi:hypothetical protein